MFFSVGAPVQLEVAPLPKVTIILPSKKSAGCVRDYKSIHALDCTELLSILKTVGFQGNALRTAYAVARAESSGRPRAFNGNLKSGDNSYGLFQINMLGRLGSARRKAYGLKSNDDLYDPLTNARIAYQMSGAGQNWRPWGAH